MDKDKERDVEMPKVASREACLRARKELLMKEKEWNRQRDALSAERRKLPMVRIEKDYVFEGPREMPGLSVFLRDGDRLFHTYSTYTRTRGLDQFLNTYNFLDHTPLGRPPIRFATFGTYLTSGEAIFTGCSSSPRICRLSAK